MPDNNLSSTALKVLTFTAENGGQDGLRYEDYMKGLSSVLAGITISQLSISLHQLEKNGYLRVDARQGWGRNRDRRIRVTPLGQQLLGASPLPSGNCNSSANQVVHREVIIREIVKIPCRHCGTLNENTTQRCPNCGAPTR